MVWIEWYTARVSEASLGPSAYIVLGFLSKFGAATSYDLKCWVDGSVGYFWSFPRSQLYAEPQRLVSLGMLTQTQEEGGRRKRLLQITEKGQAALREWLLTPAGFPELRDPGLLRMFFMTTTDSAALRALAQEQLEVRRARLHEYEVQAQMHGPGSHEPFLQTLRMGFLYEQASLQFWTEVLEGCPE